MREVTSSRAVAAHRGWWITWIFWFDNKNVVRDRGSMLFMIATIGDFRQISPNIGEKVGDFLERWSFCCILSQCRHFFLRFLWQKTCSKFITLVPCSCSRLPVSEGRHDAPNEEKPRPMGSGDSWPCAVHPVWRFACNKVVGLNLF
jgi:hypothetical protein